MTDVDFREIVSREVERLNTKWKDSAKNTDHEWRPHRQHDAWGDVFRAAHCERVVTLNRLRPPGSGYPRGRLRNHIYRIYDPTETLYVGISQDPLARIAAHRKRFPLDDQFPEWTFELIDSLPMKGPLTDEFAGWRFLEGLHAVRYQPRFGRSWPGAFRESWCGHTVSDESCGGVPDPGCCHVHPEPVLEFIGWFADREVQREVEKVEQMLAGICPADEEGTNP